MGWEEVEVELAILLRVFEENKQRQQQKAEADPYGMTNRKAKTKARGEGRDDGRNLDREMFGKKVTVKG